MFVVFCYRGRSDSLVSALTIAHFGVLVGGFLSEYGQVFEVLKAYSSQTLKTSCPIYKITMSIFHISTVEIALSKCHYHHFLVRY